MTGIKPKKILQVLLFLGVGFILLFLVYRSNNAAYQEQCLLDGIPAADCNLLKKVVDDFGSVRWIWIFAVFLCFLFSNLSRSIRWRLLVEPLGEKPPIRNMFLAIMLSYFANMGFPRIGEFVRAGVIARYSGLPAEKVMGTVVLDRLADLIIFIIMAIIVMIVQRNRIIGFLESQGVVMDRMGLALQVGILIAIAAIGIFILRLFMRSTSQNAIILKIQSLIRGFGEGLKSIAKIKKVGWFLFHSLMIWVMFFSMTYIGFNTFAPTAGLTAEAGLTVFMFGALGFIIPSPGGMGTYHFFVTEALKLYGLSPADGFSFANILFFSIQVGCNVLFGMAALILLPILNKVPKATGDSN